MGGSGPPIPAITRTRYNPLSSRQTPAVVGPGLLFGCCCASGHLVVCFCRKLSFAATLKTVG